MTWQYAIREHRLVELYSAPEDSELDHRYVFLGLKDIPHILRDWRWVIQGVWADWRRHD